MNKKIGVTGAKGYIGRALMMQPNMIPIESDVRDFIQLKMEIESKKPDLIVHLAAKTDTDFCEDKKNEMIVKDVNVHGAFNTASICEDRKIGMILLSTFQVFDGKKWFGSSYSEKHTPAPINFYGLSKLTAEAYQSVYGDMKIIRAPYIFDWERMAQHIEVLQHNDTAYPTFMKRSFMHLNFFIDSLVWYIEKFEEMPPLMHISTVDTVSWYDFMSEIADALMLEKQVLPREKELPFCTPKPHKGGLNSSMSYQYKFPVRSVMDGIALLREGF